MYGKVELDLIDTTKRENYRPISFLNIDAENPSQNSCNLKARIYQKIINNDLIGFITEMQRWFNLCNLIIVIVLARVLLL